MSIRTLPSRQLATPVIPVLVAGTVMWIALFLPECRAAVSVWIASTAYGHCFLVVPMALYLAWDRRASLASSVPVPDARLAILALPTALVWFMAERLGIMEGRQLAALGGLEVLFLSLLGWRIFRALLAPLAFLVFLVPFGAFVTPALQTVTAHITEYGLNLLHIPNYVTDFVIEIPEGTFYVAEACAGLRFLIAAVAFGVFYALLNYRSPGRRIAFIAASIVVPIFANGLRALGIVVLGHVLGSAEAAVADHIIYGWVFFSIVMVLLVMAGMPLREGPAAAPQRVAGSVPGLLRPRGVLAGSIALCLAALGPMAALAFDLRQTPPRLAALPALLIPKGCTADPAQFAGTAETQAMSCDGIGIAITTEAFSVHVKADALIRARRDRSGEMQSDDAEFHALPGTTPNAGPWLEIVTLDPYRISAASAWVDGEPQRGGLRGRLQQAWGSMLGSSYAPILITAVVALPGRVAPADQARVVAVLTKFANAQGDLGTTIRQAAHVAQ